MAYFFNELNDSKSKVLNYDTNPKNLLDERLILLQSGKDLRL